MGFSRQIILILFALVLSAGQVLAESNAKENRAYAAAVSAFQDEMWSRAETELTQFIKEYPDSANVAQVELLRAQADFKLGKFNKTIALLDASKTNAGIFADQYAYWIGEAQFQKSNYIAAAGIFDSLAENSSDARLRLQSVVESAAANAQLGDWTRVEKSLKKTDSVFQRAAKLDSGSELISRGRLLLAQAKFELKHFSDAAAILASIEPKTLKPELDWQLNDLLYRIKFAEGDLDAALSATTNLLQIATLQRRDDWRAESFALRADALEKLNRLDEALAAYQENLATNAPVAQQEHAILKIAELSVAQTQFTNAELSLQNFLQEFSNAPAADVATLALGELYLKDYARQSSVATNGWAQAFAAFDQFLGAFTNSPLAGKAYLDRGWCNWLAGKNPESLDDFKMAAKKLPPSADLAVAKFKIGDILFAREDFAGARLNYRAVTDDFTNFPEVNETMRSLALYQIVRASLKLNDVAGASNAMAQVLEFYPASPVADNSLLLVGEGYEDLNQPAAARDLFQKFQEMYPTLPLRSQVELAISRTYEQEKNWTAAITNYQNWLARFPTNVMRPQADYALAWANFQAGNETNAFLLFTNFIAQFPTNDLAPQAQWWIADHFFRAGDFAGAEINYESIFQNTNWQNSPLVYEAQMMAGRAALGRLGYSDAIQYFKNLAADTNCPDDLDAQARLAWGSALMRMDSTDTNNPLANFQLATNVFGQTCQLFSTNQFGALAWGELGDCYLQLADYDAATNAYAQVIASPFAAISARSQAQIGLGIALEKKAAQSVGDDQRALFDLAKNNYVDVLFRKNLRDDEMADSFWIKKAGLQAAATAETLGEWNQAADIYTELKKWLPQLGDSLDKKIAAAEDRRLHEKK